MTYLMLISCILLFSLQLTAVREYNARYQKGMASLFQFQGIHMLSAALCFILFALITKGRLEIPLPATLWLGLCFGILFITFFVLYTTAITIGPMSFTTLCNAFANVVPIAVGLIFWNETLSAIQIGGLLLLAFVFYLGSSGATSGDRPITGRWIAIVLGMMGCSGMLMTLAKLQPMLTNGAQISEFYAIATLLAGTASIILSAVLRRKGQEVHPLNLRQLATGAAAGLGTGLGNQLMGMLAAQGVNASVMFPFTNGGIVVVVTIISALVYKERVTRRSVLSLVIGMVALVMISL